jgi:hypothetical protein
LPSTLSSSTNYVVRVFSGGGTVTEDTAFSTYEYFISTPFTLLGKIRDRNSADAIGAIVHVRVTHSGQVSLYLSDLVQSGEFGYFDLDLSSQLRNPDGSQMLHVQGDNINVYVRGPHPDDGYYETDVPRAADSPQYLEDISLPVELSLFAARGDNDSVTLFWRTESEVDNVGFTVYRSDSRDGPYRSIGFVEGEGISATPRDYIFNDGQAGSGRTYYYYLEDVDIDGNRNRSRVISINLLMPVAESELLQNYPNPFNPETWIPFQLANESDVTVAIYGLGGELIREFPLGLKRAGRYTDKEHAIYWDGHNRVGEPVTSGLYLYTLRAGTFSQTKKMLILK